MVSINLYAINQFYNQKEKETKVHNGEIGKSILTVTILLHKASKSGALNKSLVVWLSNHDLLEKLSYWLNI